MASMHLTAEQRHRYGYAKRTPWPLRWWYIRRILTFWKMPYLIAEWAHRKGRPTLPENVQAWSQPLPPEQWAKPSPALQKANAQVKTRWIKKARTSSMPVKRQGCIERAFETLPSGLSGTPDWLLDIQNQ